MNIITIRSVKSAGLASLVLLSIPWPSSLPLKNGVDKAKIPLIDNLLIGNLGEVYFQFNQR